eukprot:gene12554-6374_t
MFLKHLSSSVKTQKRSIVQIIRLNPSKLPTISPEKVHYEAMMKNISTKVATAQKTVDLNIIKPIETKKPQAFVINFKNEKVKLLDLDPYLFDCKPRKDILHRMVVWQLAKRRQGTHQTKHRHETAFTKKKMYRQKGTGRARHRDKGSPTFIGGGRAFPKRNRDYSFKLNRRVRHLALRMALTTKFIQGKLFIVEDIKLEEPKTKIAKHMLHQIKVRKDKGKFLLVDGETVHSNFEKASWNLKFVNYICSSGLNVYDILRNDKVYLTESSLSAIKYRWRKYDPYHQETKTGAPTTEK